MLTRSSVRLAITATLAAAVAVAFTTVPSVAAEPAQHPNVRITANGEFTKDNGVRSGDGSRKHPFVISGWQINSLVIQNTDKWVVIEDNNVTGRLVLDWIGDRAMVHHNTINDLRVNQNVPRTGMPTSGHIAENTFTVVGQLRHWDGMFEHNVVGTKDNLGAEAVNFDGFNNAHFSDNTVYGFVQARLHGHHHSSAFGAPSHMHAGNDHGMVDHTKRFHQVWITGNKIYSTNSYALSYVDTNHAANDRTAASEQDPDLNKPHVHHTRVYIHDNTLRGAGILVNVFNANDPNHIRTAVGLMDIRGNKISLDRDVFLSGRGQLMGIEVTQARNIHLNIEHNRVIGQDNTKDNPLAFFERWDSNAGIYLHTVDLGRISVIDNRVDNRLYGVRAEQFPVRTTWLVRNLETHNVGTRVSYDRNNVANAPQS